jgi:hypothetical protein
MTTMTRITCQHAMYSDHVRGFTIARTCIAYQGYLVE